MTVSPVGAFVLGASARGPASGYAANLGWSFDQLDSHASFAGYLSGSALYTAVTPLAVRWTPTPKNWLRPFVGAGASVMLDYDSAAAPMRVGAEASAGIDVTLSDAVFLCAEGRYQNFSFDGAPFSPRRLALSSAFLGVGFSL